MTDRKPGWYRRVEIERIRRTVLVGVEISYQSEQEGCKALDGHLDSIEDQDTVSIEWVYLGQEQIDAIDWETV